MCGPTPILKAVDEVIRIDSRRRLRRRTGESTKQECPRRQTTPTAITLSGMRLHVRRSIKKEGAGNPAPLVNVYLPFGYYFLNWKKEALPAPAGILAAGTPPILVAPCV